MFFLHFRKKSLNQVAMKAQRELFNRRQGDRVSICKRQFNAGNKLSCQRWRESRKKCSFGRGSSPNSPPALAASINARNFVQMKNVLA
jgi:hypothetical protein